jgi:hypothetical protein
VPLLVFDIVLRKSPCVTGVQVENDNGDCEIVSHVLRKVGELYTS